MLPVVAVRRRRCRDFMLVVRRVQGIDSAEIIDAVHARRAPMIPVEASLRL
jgi:hypothetical protein